MGLLLCLAKHIAIANILIKRARGKMFWLKL